MNIVHKMKQDWDRRAKHHSRYWIATEAYEDENVFAQSGKDTAEALLASLGDLDQSGWKVLDIGCGIGRVLKPLAAHFRYLAGVDVSSEMIAKSKEWLRGLGNVETYETSGVDLNPFSTNQFDLVYSYVTFQHMPRPVFERYLEEINRVLKPQGVLAFQLPIGPRRDAPLEDTIAVRFYEHDELQKNLNRNGFRLLEQKRSVKPLIGRKDKIGHQFRLAKKVGGIRPDVNVGWLQVECGETPSFLDTHMYLSFAEQCLQHGRDEEAITSCQELLEHNPSSLEGWLQLARIFMETGRTKQALTTLQKLKTIHPTYHPSHLTLDQLQQKLGQHQEAASSV